MLPDNVFEKDAEKPVDAIAEAYGKGLVDAYMRKHMREEEEDRKLRNDPDINRQMTKLIPELGGLIKSHAKQLGAATEADCPFQVDEWAELLTWRLIEFLSAGEFDGESREANVRAYQLTKQHAAYHFDVEV